MVQLVKARFKKKKKIGGFSPKGPAPPPPLVEKKCKILSIIQFSENFAIF